MSSRSAMARNARCAPSRLPSSWADCACSNSASGSLPAWRRATSACWRAAVESPWPIASRPWVMAWRPRALRRSRRLRLIFSGMRQSVRNRLHASIAATTVTPSPRANTGSEVWTRKPPHASVTSPVWSATHAAPAAASAINTRNRMIRYIKNPIAPVWRAPPWRQPRIDGRRPAPHRGHPPCRARLARPRDRPAPASSTRAALRQDRCAAPPP